MQSQSTEKLRNFLESYFNKGSNKPFVSVDIGASAIKVMTLDRVAGRPKLIAAGSAPTPVDALNNNVVKNPEQVAEVVRRLLEANEIESENATIAIPGPAVFTKKITIAHTELKDLDENIGFEASNYIPHSIDAVHLDYQVLRSNEGGTMDVLLVAVKNEVIQGYIKVLELAGLEASIADVDYFALENMFELNYPDETERAISLINIGARYSTVSILEDGQSLFTGDVGVGGKLYTDALCDALGVEASEAEQIKKGTSSSSYDQALVTEAQERTTGHIASELHRQLGFFWNAASTEKSIEAIYLTGGASRVPGLREELSARVGIEVNFVESFKLIDWMDSFDKEYIEEIQSTMGVSVGLALRRFGDKRHAY